MKRWTFLAAAASAALVSFAASAQTDWPTKPISLVVPYPPGGVNDAVARVYADKLATELGKPVNVVASRLASYKADGVVALPSPDDRAIMEAMAAQDKPVVCIVDGHPDLPSVTADDGVRAEAPLLDG